jgi:hypothetical protein
MSLNTLDKYLQATPATVKKGNLKRTAVEDVIITEESTCITDEDECCDDVELDMDDDDLLEFTQQAYCTQADLLDETDSEFEHDGMTQTHDFTQEEEINVSAMEQEFLAPRKNAFHKDTEQQVSIEVMGIQRIFGVSTHMISHYFVVCFYQQFPSTSSLLTCCTFLLLRCCPRRTTRDSSTKFIIGIAYYRDCSLS